MKTNDGNENAKIYLLIAQALLVYRNTIEF